MEDLPKNSEQNQQQILNLENPYDLIDGASGEGFDITSEFEKQRNIIADKSNWLDDRLEAFGDIMDSEVGDTSMVRARNIEREVGARQIYLKFEGGNPTGTQKDRIAFAQAMDAMRRGFETMTLATCGNYGVACSLAASIANIKCKIFVPETYHAIRIKEMVALGAEIVRVPGDYERAVEISSEVAQQEELYDANPGGTNITLQLKAYGEIANEIYDDLRDAPSIVAVPVSNGTTIAGIYKGFLSLYRRGKTSKMPRFVAGSSFKKNPIIHAYLTNKETAEDLQPDKIKESKINEPLINWHSIDGDLALEAIRNTNGWAADATDKAMLSYSKLIREKEGMFVLPASTAGLIALINKNNNKETINNDRFVVVLTGRK
ncbi:MAG: pyridoxal-phosphate dependent enzyme [Ignavibacteriales bacterium]|nr:pyridoxal-phosphate dependent enzyme [Ignavibacteriota bacterium]MCB9249704.1 pyridoxal-phosphate dependent enzyme [Ignavibacteriales bacterium]